MNVKDGIKIAKEALNEANIKYEEANGDSLFITLYEDKLEKRINILINFVNFNNSHIKMMILTEVIPTCKNKEALYKEIEYFNMNVRMWKLQFNGSQLFMQIDTLHSEEGLFEDIQMFLIELLALLEDNYDRLMKANWS